MHGSNFYNKQNGAKILAVTNRRMQRDKGQEIGTLSYIKVMYPILKNKCAEELSINMEMREKKEGDEGKHKHDHRGRGMKIEKVKQIHVTIHCSS